MELALVTPPSVPETNLLALQKVTGSPHRRMQRRLGKCLQNKRRLLCVCVCFCFVCIFNISFGVSKGNEIKSQLYTSMSEKFLGSGKVYKPSPSFPTSPNCNPKNTTVFSWCMLMMGIHGIFEGTNLMSLCVFFPGCFENCQLHFLKLTNSLPLKIGLPKKGNPSSN